MTVLLFGLGGTAASAWLFLGDHLTGLWWPLGSFLIWLMVPSSGFYCWVLILASFGGHYLHQLILVPSGGCFCLCCFLSRGVSVCLPLDVFVCGDPWLVTPILWWFRHLVHYHWVPGGPLPWCLHCCLQLWTVLHWVHFPAVCNLGTLLPFINSMAFLISFTSSSALMIGSLSVMRVINSVILWIRSTYNL